MVRKVLRTFPMKYDWNVSTLEERDVLDDMIVYELQGIFTAYEMRMGHNEPSRKEAAFKSLSKNQLENLDDDGSLFINKLERGTGKYKGNLSLKCFNCGRIGHFSNKCPYPKQEESDHEESCCNKDKTMGKKKFKKKKKNFYSKEDSDNESEDAKILFIGKTNSYEESKVDIEAQYMSIVDEIETCRKRNKELKEKSSKYQK